HGERSHCGLCCPTADWIAAGSRLAICIWQGSISGVPMVVSNKVLTLDGFRELLARMPGADLRARAAVGAREATLEKPEGALGRLEELVQWLAAWQGQQAPTVERARVVVFAASHGVTKRGVSAYPPEVTRQMLHAL